MSFLKTLLVPVLLISFQNMQGQYNRIFKKHFADGQYYMLTENYDAAIKSFQNLINLDPQNSNVHYLTGMCYTNMPGQKALAKEHYEAAIMNMSPRYRDGSYRETQAPYEALLGLARTCQVAYDFQSAIEYYVRYRNYMDPGDFASVEFVNKQIEACELAGEMVNQPMNVQFVKLEGYPIDYKQNNYRGVASADQTMMMYMSNKPARNTIMMIRNEGGIWSEPEAVNTQLGIFEDGLVSSLSHDGNTLLLTRSDPFDSDIYISYYKGGKWTEAEQMTKGINTVYFESHACLSSDGKILYFTSNRKGGYGALDIYKCIRTEKEEWGRPENLGPTLNSPYNEDTPFITEDGSMLFFSSQGHVTMGGYDIFVCTLLPDGSWSVPENLGYPVNGPDDELFYVPVRNGESAIFASAGRNGNQQMGIYTLKFEPPQEEGLMAGIDAGVIGKRNKTTKEADLHREAETEVHGTKTGSYLVLKNLFFDFDHYRLDEENEQNIDRLYMIMNQYPDLSVEVVGHSDAMGSEAYNLELSLKRANSVVSYLANKGIARGRFISRGVGEMQNIAINENADGTDSPEGRELNRHVEIRLMNYENENITVEEIFVPEHLRPTRDMRFSVLLANSQERFQDIPRVLNGVDVREIETDESYLYTVGSFDNKLRAMDILYEVLDRGFQDAFVVEKRELDKMISQQTRKPDLSPSKYTIQILAMNVPLDMNYFIAIQGVRRIQGEDGLYRYLFGEFESVADAKKVLPGIKAIGYPDAFIMNLSRYQSVLADNSESR
jgi:outer membrane protein OmpA-like peptidoglycan-associated protein